MGSKKMLMCACCCFLSGLVVGVCWLTMADAMMGLDGASVLRYDQVKLREELHSLSPSTDEAIQSLAVRYGASYDRQARMIRFGRADASCVENTPRGSCGEYFDVPLVYRLSFGVFGQRVRCSEVGIPVPVAGSSEK
jgi:hypothetical protein